MFRITPTYMRYLSSRPSAKSIPSLEQFLHRARVLSLYRTIMRGTLRIQEPVTRAETRQFARDEFKRNKGVTDASHARYLLSTGRTEWERIERFIGGM